MILLRELASGKGVDFEGNLKPVNAFEEINWVYYSFPLNCNEKDSISLYVACQVNLYVPNSFTPNNDQVNDFF